MAQSMFMILCTLMSLRGSKKVIKNLCGASNIEVIDIQKQEEGGKDCGLFSIAIATALLFGEDPSKVHFN